MSNENHSVPEGFLNCNMCDREVKAIAAHINFDDQRHYCINCINQVNRNSYMNEAHLKYQTAKEYVRSSKTSEEECTLELPQGTRIATPEELASVGLRYNSGKAEMHQVPTSLMRGVAEVLMYGEQKYAKGNWKKGMKWTIPYDCLMRHMYAWLDGEEKDAESELSHLYHAAANIAMLIEYKETHKELDDREY